MVVEDGVNLGGPGEQLPGAGRQLRQLLRTVEVIVAGGGQAPGLRLPGLVVFLALATPFLEGEPG